MTPKSLKHPILHAKEYDFSNIHKTKKSQDKKKQLNLIRNTTASDLYYL